MKVIQARLLDDEAAHARFAEEARTTAWLEHPSIIPVHHVGRLPDGRLYYTMPEVHGKTLSEAVREVHEAVVEGRWRPTTTGLSFRGLVESFRRACDAVAFAHERGVVHGDLKPDNVMIGRSGEVYVLDWGLARVLGDVSGGPGPEPAARALLGIEVALEEDERIVGTLAYLPPERLWNAALQRSGDVYALGAILYEILAGSPPYGLCDPISLLHRLASGPPEPVDEVALDADGPELPPELVHMVEAAMRRDEQERPLSAAALAFDSKAWLDGYLQEQRAMELVAEAGAVHRDLRDVLEEAHEALGESQRLLSGLAPTAPASDKRPAWDLAAEARALEVRAARYSVEYTQTLHAALRVCPDYPAAHEALAGYYQSRHTRAEEDVDRPAAERYAALLREHDRLGAYSSYLRGDGSFDLETRPTGARVELFEYVEQGRRLVPRPVRVLGTSPLGDEPLPMGSYLMDLHGEGRATVAYPVEVGRAGHWDGLSPDASGEADAVELPATGSMGEGDCYVPAGWFRCGGDPAAPGCLDAARVWLDPFVIRRDPVTHEEFVAFLEHLVCSGDELRANELAPRIGASPSSARGELLYGRTVAGGFSLEGGSEAVDVRPDRPVVCVTWEAADAYARWRAVEEGCEWRLPGELEWEKAARGVDGRFFPWGDHLDPTWCNMRDSHATRPSMCAVGEFPVDTSPYGVRGMAGNVRDWCCDAFDPAGPKLVNGRWTYTTPPAAGVPRVGRGGTWCVNPVSLRAAYRAWFAPSFRSDDSLGFRLACSYPDGWNLD